MSLLLSWRIPMIDRPLAPVVLHVPGGLDGAGRTHAPRNQMQRAVDSGADPRRGQDVPIIDHPRIGPYFDAVQRPQFVDGATMA